MSNCYYLRKNKFYYSDHQFHQGKSTQLIGVFDNYKEARTTYLEHTRNAINSLCGDGAQMSEKNLVYIHRYLMFRNVLKNGKKLGDIINKDVSMRNLWDYNNYFMSVDSLEEVELFDTMYPTNSVEIILTNNDYLLVPKWNPKFFELTNQEIPQGRLTYDETSISDHHLTKGIYTDELDFWANLKLDVNAFGFTCSFLKIDITNKELIGVDDSWIQEYRFQTNEDKLHIGKLEPELAWLLNEKLAEPPIIFEKLNPKEVREHEKRVYKDYVIESYLNTRFVPAHYYSHETIMGLDSSNEKFDFWSHIFITEDLAKEIINDSMVIVESRAMELEKNY